MTLARNGGVPLRDEVVSPATNAVPSYGEISEAWLLGRARELVAVVQRSAQNVQHEIIEELEDLLSEARRRAQPMAIGQMLRSTILARLTARDPNDVIDPLVDELLALSQRHGILVLEAGAHALRGRGLLQAGRDDDAVTEAALALAMLDQEAISDPARGQRGWQRLLAAVLVDIALALTQLGVYEVADQVMARADRAVQVGGGPHEIAIHLFNRVRLQLGWALRLERVGDEDAAADRIQTAAAMAAAAEGPFQESLFPRDRDRAAADQIHVLGAACAMAHPAAVHIDRLRELLDVASRPSDIALTSIALARCLNAEGLVEEALDVLADVRELLADDVSEPVLRLSLVREFAQLSGPDGGERTTSALEDYTRELEQQLWATRDSRIATLTARREHERLSREHGAIAIQAMQDPLTGLPNRRALDERLAELTTLPTSQVVSIALVDLDGFKRVNDRSSHAEGDDVLRVVAGTLRNALRGDDLVARYGGDEFVALLPGAPLGPAEAALNRAARAVAELPHDLSRGVTLSVGVVTLRPHETAADVLARADAAMYLAKRGGGNAVAAVSGTPVRTPDDGPSTGPQWALPDTP